METIKQKRDRLVSEGYERIWTGDPSMKVVDEQLKEYQFVIEPLESRRYTNHIFKYVGKKVSVYWTGKEHWIKGNYEYYIKEIN